MELAEAAERVLSPLAWGRPAAAAPARARWPCVPGRHRRVLRARCPPHLRSFCRVGFAGRKGFGKTCCGGGSGVCGGLARWGHRPPNRTVLGLSCRRRSLGAAGATGAWVWPGAVGRWVGFWSRMNQSCQGGGVQH